ncbi:MAG: hypothetical protein BRC25_02050 [Parcubacteria group bacterium SW_6_46_9]|nr:MAG: hypothetical protein BRC25_02050 [Parcubacteria group bacterium SW_6_46_9]
MRLALGVILAAVVSYLCIENPQEFTQLGLNPKAISFAGTMTFAVLGSWGLIDQFDRISNKKSGDSVSVPWFEVQTASFCSFLIYGNSVASFAVFYQGIIRSLFLVPILYLLWIYEEMTRWQVVLLWMLALILIANYLLPYNGAFFVGFAFANLMFLVSQPLELWIEKSPGDLSIRLIIVYGLSSLFWAGYGFAFDDTPITLLGTGYSLLYIVTAGLWFYYDLQATTKIRW